MWSVELADDKGETVTVNVSRGDCFTHDILAFRIGVSACHIRACNVNLTFKLHDSFIPYVKCLT